MRLHRAEAGVVRTDWSLAQQEVGCLATRQGGRECGNGESQAFAALATRKHSSAGILYRQEERGEVGLWEGGDCATW